MTYASSTTVSPEKSRMEIEQMLFKFGASEFGVLTKPNSGAVGFVVHGIRIMIEIPLPSRDSFKEYKDRHGYRKFREPAAQQREYEQAVRSRWRSLCLLIKAKMVGIQEGATTFEVEFLPYMITANGQTFGERMLPRIAAARGGGQLLLTAE